MTLGLDNNALQRKYEPTQEEQDAATSAVNKKAYSNWATFGSSVSVSGAGAPRQVVNTTQNSYGSAVGNAVTPPSQLMALRDPATKMAIASSRGAGRSALKAYGSAMDGAAAGALTNSNQNILKPPPAGAGGSQTTPVSSVETPVATA